MGLIERLVRFFRPEPCPKCLGEGRVVVLRPGEMARMEPCPKCNKDQESIGDQE